MVTYKSTRGGSKGDSFEKVCQMKFFSTSVDGCLRQALLSTYCNDGGLYVPEHLPMLTYDHLARWRMFSFSEICAEIMHFFTGIAVNKLRVMARAAFSKFNDGTDPPLPMESYGGIILLDTSRGPTLAFKDIGQQVFLLSQFDGLCSSES